MTERELLQQEVSAEADRLEAEGWGIPVIAFTCALRGFDFGIALRTYRRDGVPWYVTKEKARLLSRSIEEQLEGRAA